jgi:molybdenum cofactor synthesis domain-containing protein
MDNFRRAGSRKQAAESSYNFTVYGVTLNRTRKAHVITVSDSCAAGTRVDGSGPLLRAGLEADGWAVTGPEVVTDDISAISEALYVAVRNGMELVITTGGTGFAPRDVTPEATRLVIDREAPGLSELLRWKGYQKFERAVLSRGVSGIAGSTLIVNLPGSTGGVRDGLETLLPLLDHACGIINDEATDHSAGGAQQRDTTPQLVDVIESNIDDVSPEVYELLFERLLEAGALDVAAAPLLMKKQRPGMRLTVIAEPHRRQALANIIFAETGSFGVRFARHHRITLERDWTEVDTAYGPIRIKIGKSGLSVVSASPEYRDVKLAAASHSVPLKEVYAAAVAAYRSKK